MEGCCLLGFLLRFREEEGRWPLFAHRISHLSHGSHPLGPLNPLLPLPACSTLYFPPSYDEYLSSGSPSLVYTPFTSCIFLASSSSPSIFLLVYFPLPSLSFSFSVPSSVPSPPFPLSTVEGTASSLFKFIVLLNHDATRGRGKLITRPGRNLLVLFANGGRERREQLWEIDSRSNALLIVEEDFPEYSS